ncbi:unnamed protein product [marine sediment metagenome]|uniref:Type II secretion system protein GspG C-terminal domain-containing protein n=1 Tax=marine sediment metagenome TaxID=412755 RepID=X1SYF5_9ZZZZ
MRQLALGCPRACIAEVRLDARLGNAEQTFALKIYKVKHGEYPAELSQLLPDILPELPKDPYTGEEYCYHKVAEGFVIYSLGQNLQDDGGVSHEKKKWKGDYDIVWKSYR